MKLRKKALDILVRVIRDGAYSNLETGANASQSTINSAIDSKIGSLLSIELITVVDNLPS